MIQIRLDALFRRQPEQAKRGILGRLLAGVDSRSKPLAPKARPDGDPVGGKRVPAEIAAGTVSVKPDGWSILFGRLTGLLHRGHDGQPARKIAALSRAERARFQRETEDEVARQITAQLARGAR